VGYPARVSSVDWSASVGFTPTVNGGILSLWKDRYWCCWKSIRQK